MPATRARSDNNVGMLFVDLANESPVTQLMRKSSTTRSSVPSFDFFVTDPWLACVSHASVQHVQIIQQVFDFLANLRKLSSFLPHCSADLAFQSLSHRFFSCLRFCG